MNDVLLYLVQLAVIICVTLVTRYLIPWAKENTSIAQSKIIADLVNVTVQYVEQTMGKPGMGATRKEIVTQFIKQMLTEKNLAISDEELNALIEAAVYAMNNEKTPVLASEVLKEGGE